MAKGQDTRHHPDRKVDRQSFAAPAPGSRRFSGPVTEYDQNTVWASDPVSKAEQQSWGAPTGPAANLQPAMNRGTTPTAVSEAAKQHGGLLSVQGATAIPLNKHGALVTGTDIDGNYVAKPHAFSPDYANETGADALNRHIEGTPGTYPGGNMKFDAAGAIHSGRDVEKEVRMKSRTSGY